MSKKLLVNIRNNMTTLHNIYEDILKKYEESPNFWCDSHGYRCEECKLDGGKQLDFIKASSLQFIDSEIERHEKILKSLEIETEYYKEQKMTDTVYSLRLAVTSKVAITKDTIAYLQEQRRLIENK